MEQKFLETVLDRQEFSELLQVDTSNLLGRRVLVTGASGSVGGALVRKLRELDINCLPTNRLGNEDCTHMDVANKQQVFQVIRTFKPQIIVHLAAKTSVPWCENNVAEALAHNTLATQYITDAVSRDTTIIFASSSMSCASFNVYGRTKFFSEQILRRVRSRTIRFFNIIPSEKFLIDRWTKTPDKDSIIVPEGVHRTFISREEAVGALLYLMNNEIGMGVFGINGIKRQLLSDIAQRLYPFSRLKFEQPLAGGNDFIYPEYCGKHFCNGRIIARDNHSA